MEIPRHLEEEIRTRTLTQLVEFCCTHDPFQHPRCTHAEVSRYVEHMMLHDRMRWVEEEGAILGYVESWRLTYAQVGRLLCQPTFNPMGETLHTGPVCYLANVVVHPDHRDGTVLALLKTQFFQQHYACDYFIGEARRKRHQPWKVWTRQAWYDHFCVGVDPSVHVAKEVTVRG